MKYLLPPPVRQFSGVYYLFVKFSNNGFCVFFPVALLKLKTSVSLFHFLLHFELKIHSLQPNPNLPYYCCPIHLQTVLPNGIYKRLNNCLWVCWSDCLPSWLLFSCYSLIFPSCLHLSGIFFLPLSLIALYFRPFVLSSAYTALATVGALPVARDHGLGDGLHQVGMCCWERGASLCCLC